MGVTSRFETPYKKGARTCRFEQDHIRPALRSPAVAYLRKVAVQDSGATENVSEALHSEDLEVHVHACEGLGL